MSKILLEGLGVHVLSETEEKRAGWSFIICFHLYLVSLLEYSISYSLSLAFPPPTLFLSLSDVIVSCPVDADAQLKAVCTDPKLNVYCSAYVTL